MGIAPELHHSACPHDCPSTCSLVVELHDGQRIGKVRGAPDNSYTAGVICSKVARYAERIHHPDRLIHPLKRSGPRGSGQYTRISWDEALDEVAARFQAAEGIHGPATIWPYFYAGTMGLVMRDGINRLRHAKRYSGQYSTICTTLAWNGWMAGAGRMSGSDPREMAESDVVVIWGTNAASTQVNVMTHALRARRERGAKLVVVDTYRNATAEQADLFLNVKPGTDAALACGVMHVLFRDGLVDRAYMARHTRGGAALEAHLATRTPAWASAICGVPVADIEAFASLVGTQPRSFFRLGYGFARQRNGAVSMHAAACIPALTGAWQHRGGGAFHNNGAIFHWNRTLIDGLDVRDPSVRMLDQSRIGPVLTGDPRDLGDGPPVTALLIQNTNPMAVAPDLNLVHRGFAREDLFICVHEQFMTETAAMADIVLPATMFLEHDDLYQAGGQQHIQFGPKILEAPGECRSNHELICGLALRLGAEHRGFGMSPREIVDWTLQASGWGTVDELAARRWIDAQPAFEDAHFLNGFGHADQRFHFDADWAALGPANFGPGLSPPALPDYWPVIEEATVEFPLRLVTAPARHFLNTSFTEAPTSIRRESRPTVMVHPADAAALGIDEDARVRLSNPRGTVVLHATLFDGVQRGVVIVESIWPNAAFEEGIGINALTGADPGAPVGGAAFHDNRVKLATAPASAA
jgi:anaerobic selenocysteine-containing dehydrogenase